MTMDIKVLAAVFITLFGIAMGMAQGDIQVDDLSDLAKLAERFKNIRSLGGGLPDLSGGKKAPNTSMTASFTGDTGYRTFSFKESVDSIQIRGDRVRLQIAGLTTTPASVSMTLHNFTGTLGMDGNVTVDGTVRSLEVASLPFNTSKPQDVSAVVKDPRYVRIDRMYRTNLQFRSVNGRIKSSVGVIIQLQKNDTNPVVFRSFTGTFERNFTSGSYSLDGEVFRAGKKGTDAMIGGG
ncbi:MAG: hypothetical protein SVU32_05755 [Candidatus Nanohaloarchaea archaeon]|nr:hypothetical protein [Candidatus Nanohaloarchaea archaeon]